MVCRCGANSKFRCRGFGGGRARPSRSKEPEGLPARFPALFDRARIRSCPRAASARLHVAPDSRFAWAALLAAVLVAVSISLPAKEMLILRGGAPIEADRFEFRNDAFFLANGTRAAERERVLDWWLTPRASEAADVAAGSGVSDSAIERLKQWREEGRALAARYPGATGVIILDDGTFELTADHRHIYRYHFVGLVLNEANLNWANLELGFTEGRSRRAIPVARCLTPDDKLFVLKPSDIKVSRAGRGGVFFDPNARVMSAAIPGAEVGSVIEYIHEYEAYAPEDWRLFFPGFYFQSDVPVRRSVLTVRTPADVPLYWWTENWDGPNGPSLFERPFLAMRRLFRPVCRIWRKRRRDGAVIVCRRWEKRNVPPLVSEPSMPPESEVVPAVHATVMQTWDHLNRLTGSMQKERMKATPEIRRKVREITDGADDLEEKVARLYHWVQKNIRYISVKSSLSSGWSGHPAGETFRLGYGDCTDKSILFATMLHCIGVEAEPVVVRTNDEGVFVPRYPVLACNHCITELRFGGRRMYLDCTTQDHRYPSLRSDDHGVLAINFIRDERRMIPVPPGREAFGKWSRETMEVREDGSVIVQSRNSYAGMYEAALRAGWKRVPDALRRQVMQQYLNGFAPGARLVDFKMPAPQDLNTPFTLEFRYVLPDYLIRAGRLRILQIPEREQSFPEIALDRRRFAIVYRTSRSYERTVHIVLPKSLRAVDLPPALDVRTPYVQCSERFENGDGGIVYRWRFERFGRRVPATDYAPYRRALQTVETATRKPLYLEPVSDPAD